MIAEALSGLTGPRAVAGCSHDVQVLRAEMEKELKKVQLNLKQLVTTTIARMQAEADRRVDAILRSLEQMLASTPRPETSVTAP
jgi:ATP-dependent protease HslVU (ClpYQ) peptidase subunit